MQVYNRNGGDAFTSMSVSHTYADGSHLIKLFSPKSLTLAVCFASLSEFCSLVFFLGSLSNTIWLLSFTFFTFMLVVIYDSTFLLLIFSNWMKCLSRSIRPKLTRNSGIRIQSSSRIFHFLISKLFLDCIILLHSNLVCSLFIHSWIGCSLFVLFLISWLVSILFPSFDSLAQC
jgi:hypothetical protein